MDLKYNNNNQHLSKEQLWDHDLSALTEVNKVVTKDSVHFCTNES